MLSAIVTAFEEESPAVTPARLEIGAPVEPLPPRNADPAACQDVAQS